MALKFIRVFWPFHTIRLATKNARLLSGIFILSWLSACATAPQSHLLLKEQPLAIRPQVDLHETRFFPQQKYQCGPAALATVLNAQGIQVSPEDLVDKVYLPKRRGSLQLEMVAAARSYGVLAYPLDPSLLKLLKEIEAGNPVLVLENLTLGIVPRWHYAVVVGYDLSQKKLILRSANTKRLLVSLARFEKAWKRADYWAYVMLMPDQIPATANATDYIRASHDLEISQQGAAGLTAMKTAARHWPRDSVVLMALGNAEYSASNYTAAVNAFSQELSLRPDNAEAWNNYAYSLLAKQCHTGAKKAIQCAQSLAPNDRNIQQSYQEILSKASSYEQVCDVIDCGN